MYDANGIRTSKTINGVKTSFYYDGNGQLIRSDNGIVRVDYLYDQSGAPFGLKYNGSLYYYIKNVQGDIIGILDHSGSKVVDYVYDSWGKLISISGSEKNTVGLYNALRYRGYYYDTETGLYYLNSRYYDPTTGRFLNADGTSGLHGNFLSHNMFAYCHNNPVNNSDISGYSITIAAALTFIGVALISYALITIVTIGITQNPPSFALPDFTSPLADALSSITVPFEFAKKSKRSDKEKSNNPPEWVNRDMIDWGLSAQENAANMLNNKYGNGNWHKGPDTEYNKIIKYIHRKFKVISVPDWLNSSGRFYHDDYGNYLYVIKQNRYVQTSDGLAVFPYRRYLVTDGGFYEIFN